MDGIALPLNKSIFPNVPGYFEVLENPTGLPYDAQLGITIR